MDWRSRRQPFPNIISVIALTTSPHTRPLPNKARLDLCSATTSVSLN